jgi:hypothetical protein
MMLAGVMKMVMMTMEMMLVMIRGSRVVSSTCRTE